MTRDEIKLECLKLADIQGWTTNDIVERAEKFADFVMDVAPNDATPKDGAGAATYTIPCN